MKQNTSGYTLLPSCAIDEATVPQTLKNIVLICSQEKYRKLIGYIFKKKKKEKKENYSEQERKIKPFISAKRNLTDSETSQS